MSLNSANMGTPTHVQIAVLHTKDLIMKGKNGMNEPFIVFSLGKQKFQSSVKEKTSAKLLEWNEGCDIPIPSSQSNKDEVVLKVLHKASIGDNFLGRVALPLSQFDTTTKAKAKWYPLKPKVGSEKDTKYRGEIEVKIAFLIKSIKGNGSTNDLATKPKKEGFKSSLGSILSLGKKKKKDKSGNNNNSSKESISSSVDSLRYGSTSSRIYLNNNLPVINDDPGVISEEEDVPLEFKIDRIPKRGSISNMSIPEKLNNSMSSISAKNIQRNGYQDSFDENDEDNYETENSSNTRSKRDSMPYSPKSKKFQLPTVIVEEESGLHVSEALTAPPTPEPSPRLTVSASMSNIMDGSPGKGGVRKTIKSVFSAASKRLSVDDLRNHINSSGGSIQSQQQKSPAIMRRSPSLRELKVPKETYKQYEKKSKEELVAVIVGLQNSVDHQKQKIGDLEDYIDKLLLRVLDNMPSLLKNGSSIRKN